MSKPAAFWRLALVASTLLIAGCGSGGGGGLIGGLFGGVFGGGGSGGSDETIAALSSTPGTSSGGPTIDTGATIHNPEPSTMALIGGGLAGVAALRRRKRARQ